MPDSIHYSISELANEFEITTRSIRFYEDEGLLSPRRKGNTRIYGKQDRIRLQLILRGKRLGFTLAEIKILFDWYDSERDNRAQIRSMQNLIEDKRIQLQQQIEDAHLVLNELNAADKLCDMALKKMEDRRLKK
ncbi:MerR family DNA-binding transcriptional regulator [Plesiomonas shigelloides]|uniref:MerR family transcriptional regulator n=1 Tax=Plesiomonas shigelloides TaxID=703 RepID=UPI002247C233|nr:MerR family DNA-binding transcriptional regulator [Plesiomonas shigelloides]MCX2533172.1 MerR family DNA-binding transcriptional regulator [Plesiomonas shigelloides]